VLMQERPIGTAERRIEGILPNALYLDDFGEMRLMHYLTPVCLVALRALEFDSLQLLDSWSVYNCLEPYNLVSRITWL